MSEKNKEQKDIDLNAPAFDAPKENSIPLEESKEESSTEASQAEEKYVERQEEIEKEQTIPYSRMRSVIEARREAERRAHEAEERLERLERERSESSYRRRELPISDEEAIRKIAESYWGNNKEAVEQYVKMETARLNRIEEIAERRALEALEKSRNISQREEEENERVLDDGLTDLSLAIGRDLNQEEEDAVLEIADKYSPVGSDGKYLSGQPLPFDRAWEIYQMQVERTAQTSKRARSEATAATSARTESESTATDVEDDKNWRPGWGQWRRNKRLNS